MTGEEPAKWWPLIQMAIVFALPAKHLQPGGSRGPVL